MVLKWIYRQPMSGNKWFAPTYRDNTLRTWRIRARWWLCRPMLLGAAREPGRRLKLCLQGWSAFWNVAPQATPESAEPGPKLQRLYVLEEWWSQGRCLIGLRPMIFGRRVRPWLLNWEGGVSPISRSGKRQDRLDVPRQRIGGCWSQPPEVSKRGAELYRCHLFPRRPGPRSPRLEVSCGRLGYPTSRQ